MANAALEFSLNAPFVVMDAFNVARTLLPVPETKRLVSTLELPSEKYNVKGLRVNSYITVGRRSYPKDRRDTILASTYPENPSSSSPTYACTSERNVAEEYRRAVEAKSNRRQERRCSMCLHFFSYALFADVATDAASMHNNPDMYGDARPRKLIESSSHAKTSLIQLPEFFLVVIHYHSRLNSVEKAPDQRRHAWSVSSEHPAGEIVTQSPHECNSIGARQGSDRSHHIDHMDVSGNQLEDWIDVGLRQLVDLLLLLLVLRYLLLLLLLLQRRWARMIQFGGVTRIFIMILRGNRLLVIAVTTVTVIVSGRRWRRRIVGIHQHAIVGVSAVIDCCASGSLGGGGLHHYRVVVALHVRGLHDRLVRGLSG
ncbi:hypothetical protein ALC57_14023 [Trachymyrmex cornetzi]|uniref:Uncharacterized protein n=1 Tax=Trachymyrmex cornetzi TaxID=471704 RepID=A0A195DN74_9HYME|nr:hypothetical protein ALC57_14023 [Trachymyrmex cornetzi]